MRRLLRISKLQDFCMCNGRVIPHLLHPCSNNPDFRSFHCADKRHDDSETIDFSPKMETAQATMVGILTMRGYVIEYSEGNYIFCTEEELEYYKNRKMSGRQKHNAKWMAIYNDFVACYESGMTMVEIAKRNKVSERTIYRYKAYYDKMKSMDEK